MPDTQTIAPAPRKGRTRRDRRRTAAPPATPTVGDAVSRTATQVRLAGARDVHELLAHRFDTRVGHAYETRCHTTLTRAAGAMLTTDRASCGACLRWAGLTAQVVQP